MSSIKKSVLGLNQNTRYAIRVRSVNAFGVSSAWSETLVATTNPSASVPGVPTGFKVTSGIRTLILTWDASSTPGVLYRIYCSDKPTLNATAGFIVIDGLSGTVATVNQFSDGATLHPLAAGTAYYLIIQAIQPGGIAGPPSGVVTGQTGFIGSVDFAFNSISGDVITVGTLTADTISGGSLTATVGLVGSLQTGTTGARLVIGKLNPTIPSSEIGLFAFAADGTSNLTYSTSTGNLTLAGDIIGGTITIGQPGSQFHVSSGGVVSFDSAGVDITGNNASGLTLGSSTGLFRVNLAGNTLNLSSSSGSNNVVMPNTSIHVGGTIAPHTANQILVTKTNQQASWDQAGLILEDLTTTGAGVKTMLSFHLGQAGLAGTLVFTNFGPLFTFRDFADNVFYPVAASAFTVASSVTTKINIEDLPHGTDLLKRLRPVQFKRPVPKLMGKGRRHHPTNKKNHDLYRFGFVAEEMAEILPEVVHFTGDDAHPESIDYGSFVPILVKSIVELTNRVEELENGRRGRKPSRDS